jgi:hypothetical protein
LVGLLSLMLKDISSESAAVSSVDSQGVGIERRI